MKKMLGFIFASVVAMSLILWLFSEQSRGYARRLASQRATWDAERAQLEAALAEAPGTPRPAVQVMRPDPVTVASPRLSPGDIIARLQALGPAASPRNLRQAVYWLEQLTEAGADALPVIREFLAQQTDVALDVAPYAAARGKEVRIPLDFVVPPSLRFGLFDTLRHIGGPAAEEILGETLRGSRRGVEVSYLARLLEEVAPGKYRSLALDVAQQLLTTSIPFSSASPLDRSHRENLYAVLSMFNDASFASTAQSQLLQSDGQVDRSALRYLQETLGPQAVAVAAQAYQDPRVTDSARKEPLARLALNFVGPNGEANDFYQRAINDPVLSQSHRKNLIEDLNQDGFQNTKLLTERDLPLINTRISLIEQLAPNAMDAVNAAAFKEAYKDLINMRAAAMRAQAKVP